jgi:hypothetical protein
VAAGLRSSKVSFAASNAGIDCRHHHICDTDVLGWQMPRWFDVCAQHLMRCQHLIIDTLVDMMEKVANEKILCVVSTTPEAFSTRATNIQATWGAQFDRIAALLL